MKNILEEYTVTTKTLAILPAKQIDYESIVIEESQILYVRKTPFQLIETACIAYWSDYNGRRKAVMHHTGFKQKVPIPIYPHGGMYAFPTHAPTSIDCHWIFYEHVLRMDEVKNGSKKHSVIKFKTGQTLKLDISIHILETQMQRTFECWNRVKAGHLYN